FPEAPEREALEAAGVTFAPIRIRHLLDLAAVITLRRLIRGDLPDIIYAPRNGSLSVTLMATRQCPVVGYRGTIGHLSHWDPAAWLTYFHPRLAHIISVSEAVRTYLLKMNVRADRATTIYKGHDVRWYDVPPTDGRAELGIPEDVFCVGFTGAVRPVKGINVLIEAMAMLPDNIHACIVGEVRQPELLERVSELGLNHRMHFIVHRKDAAHLIKNTDICVMPSLEREGLPRAIIEAMAQARPVVVTAVGGLPELVPDGRCGYVVPPSDAAALADRIHALASSPEDVSRFGAAAREHIQTHFNIEDTITQMLVLFERFRMKRWQTQGVPSPSSSTPA
ncbi:MAG: glycosyltransferase, partial [Kiritimatiellae bacterium]|nr:glycosyltransferase [Kiritimatiellia bacterium]